MKALFVCLTDYQMLNALNIKVNLLKNKDADILFFDNKEGHRKLAERLSQTGVFKNVFLHQFTNVKGLHKYLRGKIDGVNFASAAINSAGEIKYKAFCKLLGKKYKINAKLYDNKRINFADYDDLYGIPTKDVVKDTMKMVLAENKTAKVNFIEDGTSTYWKRSIKTDLPVNSIYLYQPELANYYDDSKYRDRIKFIPQINWDDDEFRKLINFVFGFKKTDTEYNNKVIFFDQNWDPMPEYLQNLKGIKKIVLQKHYKKHLKESTIYDKKMQMFRVLADKISDSNRVIVKLHPRSDNAFIKDYLKSPCHMAENVKVPWEVVEDNCVFTNNIWVTVSSTALCTYKMIFADSREDIPMIFLYKIVYDGNKSYQEDDKFFRSFQKKYRQSVFIPKTTEEFTQIYKKLITKMDDKRKDNK